ncbi:MAG: hypothetical protein LBH01_12200 [Verrucomicrobiales bacterium]|jgi:uncharacterized protein YycO|nr:hypothetical protein [Verrucomicrobiales bacterium]
MKVFPPTFLGKLRLSILLVLLLVVAITYRVDVHASYALADKQEGDILFQTLPHGQLADEIGNITQSEWTHCGILVRENDQWQVAEAIGDVHYTPLHLWIGRGRSIKVAALRVPNLNEEQRGKITAEIKKFLNKPYDYHYAPDDTEIYCSELVYKVYNHALGIQLGQWQKLGDLNWKPSESFIRGMENGQLPLDREMITPVSVFKSDKLKRVF